MSKSDQRIACNISAIPANEREEHVAVAEDVFESIESVKEMDNGYAFRLPAKTEIIDKTGSFIARERLCCPFFTFELELQPNHGPVWLKLTGDRRVKEYVEETLLDHWDLT